MAKYTKETENNSKRGVWIAVLLGSAVLVIGAVVLLLTQTRKAPVDNSGIAAETTLPSISEQPEVEGMTEPSDGTEAPTEATEPLPDNPIDWEHYTDINPDVYAWIYVPNTGIDLPVLQSQGEEDDNLYLHHDINGNYLFAGEIYSQKKNARDFSDPVTVLYGHNMKREGERFTNLLYFQDEDFFDENEFFYIYTPGHILTYRIVSAHAFDTRHILNTYDFSKEEDFQEYLDTILDPRTMIVNVREGVELTTDDRIVTLSTCTYTASGKIRYLIQGVLTDDQPTN